MQNDLNELYAMVSFVRPSEFSSLKAFRSEFAEPIERGRDKHAFDCDVEDARVAEEDLRNRLSRFILRRTADDVMRSSLPPKTEVVRVTYANLCLDLGSHLTQLMHVCASLLLLNLLLAFVATLHTSRTPTHVHADRVLSPHPAAGATVSRGNAR